MASDDPLAVGDFCRLEGRVVLLTGAAGHLGRAMAAAIAHAGATVLASGRSMEKLVRLSNELGARGLRVAPIAFDVTRADDVARAARQIEAEHGRLDGIVNNAYAGRPERTAAPALEDFVAAATINTAAPFMLVEACRPLLAASARRQRGGASVVNVASMYGVVSPDPRIYHHAAALANPPYYGASKAGMIQLTRYLACHLAAEAIRVNAVVPGAFPSPEVLSRFPLFEDAVRAKIPAGRIGEPIDIAGPVLFLLSDAAAYITGAALPVDGGLTAW
jgi:NAD(P)-dependent dehydrogenase (short-subunit alcohol dehydrogenase family)